MDLSPWRVCAVACLAALAAGLLMFSALPAKSQPACVPVKALAESPAEHGDVTLYYGADTVTAYANAINQPIPDGVSAVCLMVVDSGGIAIAVGII